MDDVLTAKVIALVLLGSVSLILGLLPIKLADWMLIHGYDSRTNYWKKTITSVLLCFGGGVLFATSFVHIFPEVRESFEESGYEFGGVPITEIFFCGGFFLIYLIEELVNNFCHVHEEEDTAVTVRVRKSFSVHARSFDAKSIRSFGESKSVTNSNSPSPNVGRRRFNSTPTDTKQITIDYSNMKPDTNPCPDEASTISSQLKRVAAETEEAFQNNPPEGGQKQRIRYEMDNNQHHHSHGPSGHSHRIIRDLLTVLALSCHAIFEGLAIGLEGKAQKVWTLFAAVATHKYVISFCVGMELFSAQSSVFVFSLYMTVFALVSSVGVGIGILISSLANDGGPEYLLTVAILQALAGGTLIYVVVFEVLQREKSNQVHGMAQFVFVLIGFALLTGIEVLAGHQHGHSGQNKTIEHDHENVY